MRKPSRLIARTSLTVGLLGLLSCGGPQQPKEGDDLGLIQVTSVQQVAVGPYQTQQCQVAMDVLAILPHCGALGETKETVEGNTFHFEVHASYSAFACTYGPGPSQGGLGLCLPGMGQDPPPPPLPAGTYYVDVNGVTGSFTIE